MRSSFRFVALLLTVQAVCIGIGLWVQHRFEAWTLRQSALHDATTQLAERAQRVIDRAAATAAGVTATPASKSSPWSELLSQAAEQSLTCLVIDDESRVVATCQTDGGSDVAASVGALLKLHPIMQDELTSESVDWVELELADGEHIAAVMRLWENGYRLIAHEPKALGLARAAAQVRSLTKIQWLSLGWILVIMSVALYTMVSRYLGHLTQERRRSGGRYLRHGDAVVRTRDAVIFGLAKLAESRDPDIGEHLERITTYVKMLAKAAQNDPRFSDQITQVFVRNLGLSSALHDIGKVGIADRVLLKRGPLTTDERKHMQSHVLIGGQCLRDIERRLGSSNFLQMAREIVLCHHECWDGSGYPEGLRGTAIPLAARIAAIADFYDALSMRRVYKEAFPHERCKQMIREQAGRRFDPDLVDIWLTIECRFAAVAHRFSQAPGVSETDSESAAQQAELQWDATPVGAPA